MWSDSLSSLYEECRGILDQEGEVRQIVSSTIDADPPRNGDRVSPDVAELARTRTRRRAAGEPMAYVLGFCEFRGRRFVVDRRVIVPREHQAGLLVDYAESLDKSLRVVEVGTGCGAIAITLALTFPDLRISGSDISAHAVAVARDNSQRLGAAVSITEADGVPEGEWDVILLNPPYARDDETLADEAAMHEPRIGITGGDDGLDVIRKVVAGGPRGARLATTHSLAQAHAVRNMLTNPDTQRPDDGNDCLTYGALP